MLWQGYHGILCGACEKAHGKIGSRKCQECGNETENIVIACVMVILQSSIIGILIRNALFIYKIETQDIDANLTGVSRAVVNTHLDEIQLQDDANQGRRIQDTAYERTLVMSGSLEAIDAGEGHVQARNPRMEERNSPTEIFKVRTPADSMAANVHCWV